MVRFLAIRDCEQKLNDGSGHFITLYVAIFFCSMHGTRVALNLSTAEAHSRLLGSDWHCGRSLLESDQDARL